MGIADDLNRGIAKRAVKSEVDLRPAQPFEVRLERGTLMDDDAWQFWVGRWWDAEEAVEEGMDLEAAYELQWDGHFDPVPTSGLEDEELADVLDDQWESPQHIGDLRLAGQALWLFRGHRHAPALAWQCGRPRGAGRHARRSSWVSHKYAIAGLTRDGGTVRPDLHPFRRRPPTKQRLGGRIVTVVPQLIDAPDSRGFCATATVHSERSPIAGSRLPAGWSTRRV